MPPYLTLDAFMVSGVDKLADYCFVRFAFLYLKFLRYVHCSCLVVVRGDCCRFCPGLFFFEEGSAMKYRKHFSGLLNRMPNAVVLLEAADPRHTYLLLLRYALFESLEFRTRS